MIDLLVSFIIFALVTALAILFAKWICGQVDAPAPVTKGVLWVLGAIALIVFLVRFVKPFLG